MVVEASNVFNALFLEFAEPLCEMRMSILARYPAP
jgi:hypothetical protein